MKNQVIKVLNKEHGKKVIEYWKSKGLDTSEYVGDITESEGCRSIYYGVINTIFSNYSIADIARNRAEIITLPEEVKHPERGSRVLVWDDNESKACKRIFIDYFEGFKSPVLCVAYSDEKNFINKEHIRTTSWKNYKLILEKPKEEIVELTLKDISEGKGVGVAPHLIRIKE